MKINFYKFIGCIGEKKNVYNFFVSPVEINEKKINEKNLDEENHFLRF